MIPRPIDVHDTADERLRRDGQRYTANRRALVDAMRLADRPITVLELIEGATGMPQSSAYRNLSVLEDAGVVRRLLTADDTARFELAEDLTGHHHHHLICEACGTVTDIDVPHELEEGVSSFSAAIARSHGFRIEHHRLDLIGVCPACSTAAR